MADDQRHGRIFGVLFIITFITSIAALALYQPVLDDPVGYITGGGKDNQIYLGALLEFFLIVSAVGTAVVLYPIARRQSEALALGYVAARIMESVFIAMGIIFVLGVVGLRHDLPSANDAAFTLAALKDWTFLLGPGFFPLGNGLLLGYLMYRTGLVPRRMAWLGMIGGPLLFLAGVGALFDWWDAGGTVLSLATIPEFIWELFLGVYCTIYGFRKDSPIVRPNWRGDAVR
jgi:nitric oxide reductase large subunit